MNFRGWERIRRTEVETDDLYKLICNLSIPSRRSRWFLEVAKGKQREGATAGATVAEAEAEASSGRVHGTSGLFVALMPN